MKKHVWTGCVAGALALTLAGCVVPPGGGYYPPPAGYAPPAPSYPPPQTSYAPPPPDYTADQYVYTDGTPYAVVGGQQYVVVFDGGLGWGYYDGYHRWHGAPPRWRDDFDRRYPGGRGYAPGPPREANRPGGPPQGFNRQDGPSPGFNRPDQPRSYSRPQGPPPGRQGEQPAAFARPAAPPPGNPARPAAPPPRPSEPQHEERRACGVPGTPHC